MTFKDCASPLLQATLTWYIALYSFLVDVPTTSFIIIATGSPTPNNDVHLYNDVQGLRWLTGDAYMERKVSYVLVHVLV